jgi:hypothetical protein
VSYNGSGTFVVNSSGQPVVTGTVISSTAFNALTADLATGLSTAITKDGQTTTTARVPFAQGVSSTLVTDATSATTGSIITAGGISMQKALWVGTTSRHVGATQFDAAITYGGVTLSNAVTGTGSMVLSASPTFTGTIIAAGATFSSPVTINDSTEVQLTMGGTNGSQGRLRTQWDGTGAAGRVTLSAKNIAGTLTDVIRINGEGVLSTLLGPLNYGGVTLSNSVTGTGSMVLATSPQFSTSVGIGMTPSNVLDITQTQNAASTISIANTNAGGAASARSVYSNAATSVESGLLGSGYSTNGVLIANRFYTYVSNAAGLAIANAGPTIFANSSLTEVARIDTSGNLLVGTTSYTTGRLVVQAKDTGYGGIQVVQNGAAAYWTQNVDSNAGYTWGKSGADFWYAGRSGSNNCVSVNGSWVNSSDARLKTNIITLVDALSKVCSLRGVSFDRINDGPHEIGLIAQEVQIVYPEAIETSGEHLGLNYGALTGALVEAIKSQQALITDLTTRLAALENK